MDAGIGSAHSLEPQLYMEITKQLGLCNLTMSMRSSEVVSVGIDVVSDLCWSKESFP